MSQTTTRGNFTLNRLNKLRMTSSANDLRAVKTLSHHHGNALSHFHSPSEKSPKSTGPAVVIGPTISALACAWNLSNRGHDVVMIHYPSQEDGVFVQTLEKSLPTKPAAAGTEVSGAKVQEMLHLIAQKGVNSLGTVPHPSPTPAVVPAPKNPADQIDALVSELSSLQKKVCCVFMHSLQRNGANNCALFTVKAMIGSKPFCIISPSDGPMRTDFDELGLPVTILDPKVPNYEARLQQLLSCPAISMVLANTIMRADVVVLAEEIGLPTAWIIHEAWPPEQFEYYAKEVFMMSHIDSTLIKQAFDVCHRVIFPSNVQREIYKSLLRDGCVETIYNGIPLNELDLYRSREKRIEARNKLGYSKEDFVILHIGTICFRKGQIFTAKAFTEMCAQLDLSNTRSELSSPKLLMVGARYIREHEIKYIDEIKSVVNSTPYSDRVAILDIQKNPYPFYAAADVVVVPSLNEVLPLVICEAMAMQKPVVCSKIDAIPEAVDDGREGILVRPGEVQELKEAILRLYLDPKLRQRMGVKGRKRVFDQFSYRACQAKYETLFRDITGSVL